MRIATEVEISIFLEQLAKANIEIPENMTLVLTEKEGVNMIGVLYNNHGGIFNGVTTQYGRINLMFKD